MKGQGNAAELVAARRRVGCALVLIGDIAEHVAVFVLGPRQPKMRADAPIQNLHLRLRVRPAVDAAQADESPPVNELGLDPPEPLPQGRERKVIALENEDVVRFLQGVAQGSVELSLFRRVELLGPQRLIGHVRRGPCTLGFKDSGCRCHRHAS